MVSGTDFSFWDSYTTVFFYTLTLLDIYLYQDSHTTTVFYPDMTGVTEQIQM